MKRGRRGYIQRMATVALAMLSVLWGGQVQARECLGCHGDVLKQFKGASHHVQGTGLTGKHCYACHWEATAEGGIDGRYHPTATKSGKPGTGAVHLAVWQGGKRPTSYVAGSTAIIFRSATIGTAGERSAVAGITRHCLGCHGDATSTRPFPGDPNRPAVYAWDGQSIASRYVQTGTTTWGKYSTAGSNKKQRTVKAFSAHGNAAANQGGWNSGNGYDGEMPVTRGGTGARNVECYDCHNSHGSTAVGVTSSYRTLNGTYNGGLLKETTAGKGGYSVTYRPSVNSYGRSKNPFNAGAGLCFDCHETAEAGSATPWGYASTFGARQPVMGYKDSLGFGPGKKGSSHRFANRYSRDDVASSHLKAGAALQHGAQGQINGLCTPCHDPHGVSPTLGDKMAYAVPLLKGTWLTSPYREDAPPAVQPQVTSDAGTDAADTGTASDYNAVNRSAGANFGRGDSGAARDYNTVNREAGANFGKGESLAAGAADYNAVNRSAGANFGRGDSGAARDYNTVNREAGANFGKGESLAARAADYNAVNRSAGANFGRGDSGAARDYNTVNREAGANFGKGESQAARAADYNAVNRSAGANFGRGDSGAARDYNTVNREVGANFGKGESQAARPGDYNAVNRSAGANFGRGASGAPRDMEADVVNRDANSNFSKGGAPREPMQGMKYSVDRTMFGASGHIAESEETFAGLCLKCHSRDKLRGGSSASAVHLAVKGWGNNREHAFPCSKCHQAHSSGLPRLMQTNCFEQGPSGLRENSGIAWLPYRNRSPFQAKPASSSSSSSTSKSKIVGCHVRQFGKSTAAAAKGHEEGQWREVTSW